MVEYFTNDPKIEGLNPGNAQLVMKLVENKNILDLYGNMLHIHNVL